MTFGHSYNSFNPEMTPSALKKLIAWFAGISIFIQLFDSWPPTLFSLPSLKALFTLSLWGVEKGFIWQPLTYLFVNSTSGGISLSYLFSLAFDAYFLWILGCTLIDYLGKKRFFQVFITSWIFIGLASLLLLTLVNSSTLVSGMVPVLFSLLMAWGMISPDARLFFFFAIPMKLKTLISLVFGLSLLIEFSGQNGIQFAVYTLGILIGYLLGIFLLNAKSPYSFMAPCDQFLIRIKEVFISPKTTQSKGKKFDFMTGEEILDDDAFIDAMLVKISRQGESSLTRKEKERMDAISKQRQ